MTTNPRKRSSPTTVDLGPKSRPNLAVEFESRGRPMRSVLYNQLAQVIETGETDWIVGSFWAEGRKLVVTFQHIGTFDASEVRLTDGWPVAGDDSQRKAELRDAIVEGFLRNTQPGRRILDKLIRERDAIRQNRTPPATLPMANQAQV